MKRICLVILTIAFRNCVGRPRAASELRDISRKEVEAAFDRPVPSHPRLFITMAGSGQTGTRPNIVLIMSDGMGFSDLVDCIRLHRR